MQPRSHDSPWKLKIAEAIALEEVLSVLAQTRPVFYSEADLQFTFAQTLTQLAPWVQCRLEVPSTRSDRRSEYLDLLCSGESTSTAIEFKYFTRRWQGQAHAEQYQLRSHAAADLARLHFVHDIVRLERLCRVTGANGLAIMLTNEPNMWTPPDPDKRTNDWAFRIHEGARLTGVLEWANGYAPNRGEIKGAYVATWQDYSVLDTTRSGRFRWLAIAVPAPN